MKYQTRRKTQTLNYYLMQTAIVIAISAIGIFGQENQIGGLTRLPRPGDAHYYEYEIAKLRQQGKPKTINIFPIEQLRREFLQLQISNNNLLESRRKQNNPQNFLKSLGEIKKRAVSLNNKLPLPEKSKTDANQLTALDLDKALDLLDETVLRFTENSAFKNAAIVDAQSGEQARRDLELIVKLSRNLKQQISALKEHKQN